MAYIQIASDNFTRANGPLGANWTVQSGAWAIASNQATTATGATAIAYWAGAGVFTPNQYAIVTIGPSNSSFAAEYFGLALNDNGTTYYNCLVNSGGDYFIQKNGSNLAFALGPTLVVGDTIEMDSVGGVLTLFHNGVQFATYTDVSPLTSGVPGMAGDDAGQAVFYSNWVGGNIGGGGGGGTGSPPFGWMNMQHDFANKHGEA
jgi:hypothetical protein